MGRSECACQSRSKLAGKETSELVERPLVAVAHPSLLYLDLLAKLSLSCLLVDFLLSQIAFEAEASVERASLAAVQTFIVSRLVFTHETKLRRVCGLRSSQKLFNFVILLLGHVKG